MTERMQRASQSFLKREIDAMIQLFEAARRGGDVRIIMRNPDLANVEKKFRRAQPKTEPTRKEREGKSQSG